MIEQTSRNMSMWKCVNACEKPERIISIYWNYIYTNADYERNLSAFWAFAKHKREKKKKERNKIQPSTIDDVARLWQKKPHINNTYSNNNHDAVIMYMNAGSFSLFPFYHFHLTYTYIYIWYILYIFIIIIIIHTSIQWGADTLEHREIARNPESGQFRK